MRGLRLTGYGPSVYTFAVRMALAAKGLEYEYAEVDPFDADGRAALSDLHPFGRVPVLEHYTLTVYETGAILDYLDEAFQRATLRPDGAKVRARMRQVQGIVDAYGYWPLVRQVYVHGVARDDGDPEALAQGLAAAETVLEALEAVAAEGLVLNASELTLADCHLAPMIEAFAAYPEARTMLEKRTALAGWYGWVQTQPAFVAAQDARKEAVA